MIASYKTVVNVLCTWYVALQDQSTNYITVQEGESATFNCTVSGNNEPPFWWIAGVAYPVIDLPARHSFNSLLQQLTVSNVSLSDNGTTYQCGLFPQLLSDTATLIVTSNRSAPTSLTSSNDFSSMTAAATSTTNTATTTATTTTKTTGFSNVATTLERETSTVVSSTAVTSFTTRGINSKDQQNQSNKSFYHTYNASSLKDSLLMLN